MLPIKTFESFANGAFFDIWSPWEEAIVLGRFSPMTDIKKNNAERIPIVRRVGGGGTVLLNSGALVIDIGIYRQPKMTIRDYFTIFNTKVLHVLNQQSIKSSFDEDSFDLTTDGKKIGGVSLALRKNLVLYGLSLIIQDSLIKRIQEVLTIPATQPKYRENRQHVDFLKPLSSFPQFNSTIFVRNLKRSLMNMVHEFKTKT